VAFSIRQNTKTLDKTLFRFATRIEIIQYTHRPALEPTILMSSGNRATLTINWMGCRHATGYTKEIRKKYFLPPDFAGIGSAPLRLQ
jgi:hypothetical protein